MKKENDRGESFVSKHARILTCHGEFEKEFTPLSQPAFEGRIQILEGLTVFDVACCEPCEKVSAAHVSANLLTRLDGDD